MEVSDVLLHVVLPAGCKYKQQLCTRNTGPSSCSDGDLAKTLHPKALRLV
jgi:hypothetical protein